MGIIRESFVIFANWDNAIRQAPEDKQLELYHALMDYAKTGEVPEALSWEAKMFLKTLEINMDKTITRYRASVENGKKGGRPRDENPSEEALKKREYREQIDAQNELGTNLGQTQDKPKTNPDEPDKPKSKRTNLNDNVNVNDNVNYNYNIKESTLTSTKESRSAPTRSVSKKKYGQFSNVLLTEEEHERLLAEVDGKEAIEFFSYYREMKGYKAKNDNLAIRKWVFDAVKEERQKSNKTVKNSSNSSSGNIFVELARSKGVVK